MSGHNCKMEIVIALNQPLIIHCEENKHIPSVLNHTYGMEFSYNMGFRCVPRVILKNNDISVMNHVTADLVHQLEQLESWILRLQLDVCIPDDGEDHLPFGALMVKDNEGFLKKIFSIIGEESSELYVDVKYLDNVLSFSCFEFYTKGNHLKEDVPCDLQATTCPNLSVFRAFELLSNTIAKDSFVVTMALQIG